MIWIFLFFYYFRNLFDLKRFFILADRYGFEKKERKKEKIRWLAKIFYNLFTPKILILMKVCTCIKGWSRWNNFLSTGKLFEGMKSTPIHVLNIFLSVCFFFFFFFTIEKIVIGSFKKKILFCQS